MIICNDLFDDIESLVEKLKKNDNVIGIVEYGGRTYTDMTLGGDYDLTVIFDKPVSSNFSGVHFHIKDIPVDCMLLSKQDFMMDNPSDDFLLVHLNCKILYDKDNMTSQLLKEIQEKWTIPSELSDFEKMLFRFSFKHILDKLRHRLHDNELYSRYLIYSSLDWFLSSYARTKGWEIGKPKLHLNLIKNKEPQLYDIISNLYYEGNLEIQFDLLSQCANYMISSIGGLWKENEALFHLLPEGRNDEEEQKKLIEILMG